MDYQQLWGSVLTQIESEVSQLNFKVWFSGTKIVGYKDNEVSIGVVSEFAKDWLITNYRGDILRILRSIREEVRGVNFVVMKAETLAKKSGSVPLNGHNNLQLPIESVIISKEDGLNPKYTFDNFTVGPFNEVAHSVSQAIINNPGSTYNPFFVYGNPGLGKTHLMQAVGNSIKKKYPERKVFYTSLEKFVIDYVNSLNSKKPEAFKEKYRKYDVLIMDDVQFITGKEKSQDELFHLFNVLYENNKQIVFSSDKHPNLIQGLEDRLRTRFQQGMIVDVSTPSIESRVAILKQKTKDFEDKLTYEIYEYIANNVAGSIRELEGVAVSLSVHAMAKGGQMTLLDVKNLLKNNIKSKKSVSIQEVVKTISEYYHITDAMIYNKTRRKDVVRPRQVIMYILREDFDISYPMIGDKMGGRDHTTVIHSYEKIKEELKKDTNLTREIEDIRGMFA